MDSIKFPLEGYLGLVLECFYTYTAEVPESGLNPRENASVELDCVYLGDAQLKYDFHLMHGQWLEIENWILEQRESE